MTREADKGKSPPLAAPGARQVAPNWASDATAALTSHQAIFEQIEAFNRRRTEALTAPILAQMEQMKQYQRTVQELMDAASPARLVAEAWNQHRLATMRETRAVEDLMRRAQEALQPTQALRHHLAQLFPVDGVAIRTAVRRAMDSGGEDEFFASEPFGRIEQAVAAVAARVERAQNERAPPRTVDAVNKALGQAGLDDLRKLLDDALSAAVTTVIARTQPKTRRQWVTTMLLAASLMWQLCLATYQIVGQPLFQRMLDEHDASKRASSSPPALLRQFAVVRADHVFLRTGPHTQQRFMTQIGRGDLVRLVRKDGRWALVTVMSATGDGASYTGWVKSAQISPLEAQAAALMRTAWDIPPP